uniref:WD_REPEATS_REGION domain-containing protein n=1 Tax=Syphacia muris TaxID=451379 RepID=A0A0N5B073_9BILA
MVFVYFFHEGVQKKYEYIGKMKGVKDEQAFFVVAAACNDTVAAAMELGRVFIWDKISKCNMRIPTRTLHWHRCAPSMIITPFGALLSGGKESTLVKYSLTPSLLPHLQANILTIGLSEDGSIASILLDDNSVHFVLLASMTVMSSAKALHSRRNGLPTSLLSLVPDPLHPEDVIISGYPGRLHWINVNSGITTETVGIILSPFKYFSHLFLWYFLKLLLICCYFL